MLRGGFADFSCRTVSVGPSKGSSRSHTGTFIELNCKVRTYLTYRLYQG